MGLPMRIKHCVLPALAFAMILFDTRTCSTGALRITQQSRVDGEFHAAGERVVIQDAVAITS